jgi:hypothetical protein
MKYWVRVKSDTLLLPYSNNVVDQDLFACRLGPHPTCFPKNLKSMADVARVRKIKVENTEGVLRSHCADQSVQVLCCRKKAGVHEIVEVKTGP